MEPVEIDGDDAAETVDIVEPGDPKRMRRKVKKVRQVRRTSSMKALSSGAPRSRPRGLSRFRAQTRPTVAAYSFLLTIACFAGFYVHPLFGAVIAILMAFAFFKPAIVMVLLPPLSAIMTSANPNLFSSAISPAFIQAPFLAIPLVLVGYLATVKGMRPGAISLALIVCTIVGGGISLLTTTSVDTTFDALWKFFFPLFPLAFWWDNCHRRDSMFNYAPYSLIGVVIAVIVGSCIMFGVGTGYELNGRDFQGVFWHPQTLGITLAATCPLIMFARRLPLWLRLLLVAVTIGLVWASWTRTALGSMAAAGVFIAFVSLLKKIHVKVTSAWKSPLKLGQAIALTVLAFGSLFYASTLTPQEYSAGLSSNKIASEDAYAGARTFSLYRSYQNFSAHAAFGIGFGVPSDPRLINQDFASQAVEAVRKGEGPDVLFDKGNSYVAIFEEVGLVGAIFWLSFFVFVIISVSATGLAPASVAIVFCLSIVAEATAFSLGGVGMLMWASLFLASGLTRPQRRPRSRRRQRTASRNLTEANSKNGPREKRRAVRHIASDSSMSS
jgi:hypothetical protein